MLVAAGKGRELDLTVHAARVVPSRTVRSVDEADKEEWDILGPTSFEAAAAARAAACRRSVEQPTALGALAMDAEDLPCTPPPHHALPPLPMTAARGSPQLAKARGGTGGLRAVLLATKRLKALAAAAAARKAASAADFASTQAASAQRACATAALPKKRKAAVDSGGCTSHNQSARPKNSKIRRTQPAGRSGQQQRTLFELWRA